MKEIMGLSHGLKKFCGRGDVLMGGVKAMEAKPTNSFNSGGLIVEN